MTSIGRLWNGRTVPQFVRVEELPLEFRPIGLELNTGERTIEDLMREIKALELTVENQKVQLSYGQAEVSFLEARVNKLVQERESLTDVHKI